ncbi:YggT family protein [Qipengyuania sp. 1NDW9]|uniref:YggT family protein n=3 Tax=Qipengyuania TaxID=1855416 RepID=A0A9Q3XEM2_9SPHN|nr:MULTISPECIES: YggT family protein [Qipengyuania]MBX7491917.1 YggT family protein [Qipengyuania xiapuensis]MBY6218891.1 YggT family protein [Qipengyuania aquimaris]QZD91380.1 YggT family protein [Qipengyuania xiapuensis]
MQALATLYDIISMLGSVLIMLVIIQFIIGLLFAFNVVGRNEFLMSFYEAINRLLDPIFKPVRRFMPNTGAIDFSPLVVIILINIILIVLDGIIKGVA